MYRAIGMRKRITQQNIGPLWERVLDCFPYSHYDETITRVVISGAAFEDDALTARRGLDMAERQLHGSL